MKKVFKVLGILLLLLFVLLFTLPFLFKDKIVAKVKTEINNNVNAKVDFKDVDISVFSNFPDFTLSLDNLTVIGTDDFSGDTLTAIKSFKVSLDIMSVIKGDQIKIKTIELDQPRIHAIVLKDGKANWDIAKPDSAAPQKAGEPSAFKISLQKFEVKDGVIRYDDASLGMQSLFVGLNHTLKGDFTQDVFLMETNTSIENTNLVYEGVKYLSKVKSELKADLEMDMVKSKYTFKDNELTLNELTFGMDGWLAMPKDDIDMDLKFKAKQTEFKNFLSLIPGMYTQDFKDVKSSGKLAFDGSAKGTYNEKRMPAFTFNLQINNGMFQYPGLPAAVNNVLVDLKVNNPDGDLDHTLVNLARMHVELGKEPFDARLIMKTPISDPDIDASVKGSLNLGNVQKMIPLEKGTTVTGLVNADITAKGRMSSIDKKKFEDFKADGKILVTDLVYVSPDMPKGANMKKLDISFNPQTASLNALDARMGKSDFHASGALENLIGYALKDQTLKGTMTLTSSLIDVNEFMGEPAPAAETPKAAEEEVPMTVVEVPANIDFVLNSNINKMLYSNMTMDKVSGAIIIKDQTVKMSNLSMEMLDGKMICNGSYNAKNLKKPTINFDLNVAGFDVQKTVKTFATVKKMAPIAERAAGKYSTMINFAGDLDSKMEPILPSLNGGGNLKTENIVISNFEPLNKVGDALKMDKFKRLDLNNVNITFKFSNGRVMIDPFDVKVADVKTTISGSNGFDQTIDYTMNVEIPTAALGGKANSALSGILAKANTSGANLSMGDKINAKVLIGGTVTNPTVSVGMKDAVAGAVDNLKDKAKEEFNKKKDEVVGKVKEEADKLKKEAEDKVNAEKEKAQAEADRLKKEAEAKAQAESDRLKKEAAEKAKNKLKGLFGK